MKRLILAIALTFLFSCNFGPEKQEKAEDLVKKYLLQTLLYPSSYQTITFRPLDSVFAPYNKTAEHKFLRDKIDSLRLLGGNIYKPKKYYQPADYEMVHFLTQDSIKRENFRSVFSGWSVVHNFHARNNKNVVEQLSLKFTFDRNLKYLIDVENN